MATSGISEILHVQAGKRFSFDLERALFAMVANRACAPASKLYCHEQWLKEDVHIAGTGDLELQHLYRTMDFLEAYKDAIEQAIFNRVADLLNLDVEAHGRACLPGYVAQYPRRSQTHPVGAIVEPQRDGLAGDGADPSCG